MDLLPRIFPYRNFDVHLSERKRPTERLLKMSRSLREVYSALFLDCAPGISLLTENVLRAADLIIVPLLPTPLSVRMLAQLQDFIIGEGLADLAGLAVFFDGRPAQITAPRHHSGHAQAISVDAHDRSPYWSDIERMSLRRAPVPAFAPASAAAQIYSLLWAEVARRLGESFAKRAVNGAVV